MEYYSAIIKDEILPFATVWVELEGIMLRKQVRERQLSYDLTTYIEFKKQEKNHDRLLTLRNKPKVAGGKVGGGMG